MWGCTGTCSRSVSPLAFCRSTSPQQPLQQSAPHTNLKSEDASHQSKQRTRLHQTLLQYGSLVQWLIKISPDYQALGRWANATCRSIESGSGWSMNRWTTPSPFHLQQPSDPWWIPSGILQEHTVHFASSQRSGRSPRWNPKEKRLAR